MGRLDILVVEDSAVAARAIALAIGGEPDWRVVATASDAPSAVTLCGRLSPDLLTLDLNMPGGGGLDMLAEIKARCHAPVIVVSASTYEGSPATAEALRRGADACFDKRLLLTDADLFRALLASVARD